MLDALQVIASVYPQSYVVGGAVRDLILQRNNRTDVDVAVRGNGYEAAKSVADHMGGSFVPLDKHHGIGRIAFSERSAIELDISSFKGASIREDLIRRDFTINAMALPIYNYIEGSVHNVIDPCEGREDLSNGVIRVCSSSVFEDDPLRIIRAFRFSASLGFQICPKTNALIVYHADKIANISGERIRDECAIILTQSRCLQSLKAMDRAGILDVLFEELVPMKGLEQNYYHHLNVWDHAMEAFDQLEALIEEGQELFGRLWPDIGAYLNEEPVVGRPRKALLKMAILFHDVGKPQTMSRGQDGRIHFFGHEQVSKRLFEQAACRLKLAGREKQLISMWIENHMRPMFLTAKSFPKRGVLKLNRKCGQDTIGLYLLYLADLRASRGPARSIGEDKNALEAVIQALQLFFQLEKAPPIPLINGNDIMEEFQLKPGPYIGFLLGEIFDLQLQGSVQTRNEALDEVRRIMDEKSYEES